MSAKKSKKPKASPGPSSAATTPTVSAAPQGARSTPEQPPSPTPAAKARRDAPPARGAWRGELHAPDDVPPLTRRKWWLAALAILVACVFGAAIRVAWVDTNRDTPGTMFQDKRLLTTADAYFYASGVQHEVQGTLEANPRVPGADDSVLVAFASAVVHLTGLPVETVCLWLPALIAPLIAVPLILLGLLFRRLAWGFFASLVAVLGFSYWNRTMPGYFDTDMVTIPYVTGIALLLVTAFWRRRTLPGTVSALLTTIAPYMHPGSERVIAALSLGVLGYALVFTRREHFAYRIALALFIALLPLPFWLRMAIIAALELGLARVRLPLWSLASLTGVALVLATWLSPSMDLVLGILGIRPGGDGPFLEGVSFVGIGETVAELANPSLAKLAERIAGHPALLVVGTLGYLAACWRHRPLLLLTPLLALGTVFAAQGQRYTIFAVPVVALGNMWLVLLVARFVARRIPRGPRLAEAVLATALALPPVVPAVNHALTLPSRTALNTQEAALLTGLAPRVKPGDFLFTWWDYAYGAWFHAGVNTVIDGSKQNQDTWLVAEFLFTRSQREAAALARLASELQPHHAPMDAVVDDMIAAWQRQGGGPVSDFVPALRAGRVPLPNPTRQVFVYLPWRILTIAPNIATIRPAKGLVPAAEIEDHAFIVMNPLSGGSQRAPWSYDADKQVVVSQRGERLPVFKVATITNDARGRLHTEEKAVSEAGRIGVVNLRHSNMQLLMDRGVYESVLAQLLVFGRPDPALFELVTYDRGGAIYRVRP